jgi:cystinosin
MYGSPVIRRLYRERHGASAEIAVQSNDVAFAVHAVFLSTATLAQIFYYDASRLRQQPVSKLVLALIGGILMTATATGLLLAAGKAPASINWLDYLYLLSYFKILITLVKYVPQVFLNYQRRSTAGFSVWQILLDLSGGVLSDSQLVGDCLNLHDWSGITGNLAKFFLGFVSIVFDIIILLQHYVWFPEPPPEAIIEVVSEEEEEAAIANDKQDEESETVPIV